MTKDIARNEARQAIVECALAHLAARGPANVHPKDICEELGLSKALVNYHFGGRDGLIIEAMAVGFERCVDDLWIAAEGAGKDPVARLLAWVDRQVTWTADHAGLASALQFPHLAAAVPSAQIDPWVARLAETADRNTGNLHRLVRAARTVITGIEPTDVNAALDTAAVAWLATGLSVWNVSHQQSAGASVSASEVETVREHAREQVRALLSR